MHAGADAFSGRTLMLVGALAPWATAAQAAGWQVTQAGDLPQALSAAATEPPDVLAWFTRGPDGLAAAVGSPAFAQVAAATATVVVASELPDTAVLDLIHAGLDDVLVLPEALSDAVPADLQRTVLRSLAVAATRKQLAVLQRKGGSIDLATGLPTRQQWLDHLSQMCALREREPAPMAVVVLRLSPHGSLSQGLDERARALVQRKLAVRLRAALRASDVVGTVASDAYAVLLAWMESPTDAEGVSAKLRRTLEGPLRVGLEALRVSVTCGVAHHGADGRDAPQLLQAAALRAGASAVQADGGLLGGAVPTTRLAANDDSATG